MDFNKLKEMGLEYAEKGKNVAMDLAERGKTQAKIVNSRPSSPRRSANWAHWSTASPRAMRKTSPSSISTSR